MRYETEGSCYDDYFDDPNRISESEWNRRSAAARTIEHSRLLPRWKQSEGFNPKLTQREQVDAWFAAITPMLTAHGFVVLADGYNDDADGFAYFINCVDTYHRNMIVQAPGNNALVFTLKLSTSRYPESEKSSLSGVSIDAMGQCRSPIINDAPEDLGPISMWGFYHCGGSSYGGVEESRIKQRNESSITRWRFSTHLEDNDIKERFDSPADPKKVVNALRWACRSVRGTVCAAPFIGHTYTGGNMDNSRVYSKDHSTSRSHEVFWQRAGKAKVLEVIPNAMFSQTTP